MAATITSSPRDAIEEAFAEWLATNPDLDVGIDIVAASNRDALVGPIHAFVLCTEFLPATRTNPNGKATVAVGLVTDLDDQGYTTRQQWLGRILAALSIPEDEQGFMQVGGAVWIVGWSIVSQKDETQDRKIMDVITLRVAATATPPA